MKGSRFERGQGKGTSGLRVRNGRSWALFIPLSELQALDEDARIASKRQCVDLVLIIVSNK